MNDPLTDVDLNQFDPLYSDFTACLMFLRSFKDVDMLEGQTSCVHMYWKLLRPFGRKQIIPVKSFIATQNFEQLKLILWSDKDLSENEFLKPWLKYVQLKIYDPLVEAQGTPLEGNRRILTQSDSQCYTDGDLFRALICYKYGGVYVDMDSVCLRDFRVLLGNEFMYTWGRHLDQISSAVMHLHKESDLGRRLLDGIVELPPANTNWGCQNNMRAYALKKFKVYPAGFFNPEWQIPNTACTFEINDLSHEPFEGTFTHHWHNRWEKLILPGCKFELLEAITDRKLREKGLV